MHKLVVNLLVLSLIIVWIKPVYAFAENMFATVDKNRDEVITWDEAKTAKWTIEKFRFVDANGDKKVVPKESWTRQRRGMSLLTSPGNATLMLLRILDSNPGDGKNSVGEWENYFGDLADEFFKIIDLNQDALVTKSELEAFVTKYKGKRLNDGTAGPTGEVVK